MTTNLPTGPAAAPAEPVVAFQGEHGAFSEEACRRHFGQDVKTLPCRTFEDIFAAVDEGRATYGTVPVENSTAGSINKSFDLLLDHDLKLHGEILLRVHHNLLTIPGNAAGITQVRSHPQALAQCESYLNRHKYAAVPWYDTAGSAKYVREQGIRDGAAIACEDVDRYDRPSVEVVSALMKPSQNFVRFFPVRTKVRK